MTDKPTTEEAIKEWNKRGHHYEHADKPTQNEQAIAALEKIRTAFCLLPQKLQSEQYQAYLEIQSALTDAVVIDAPEGLDEAIDRQDRARKGDALVYSTCAEKAYQQVLADDAKIRQAARLYAQGRKQAVPDGSAPERYWLIEQPDLEDDDDYKRIHTTDLDVYADARIIGEYRLIKHGSKE